MRLPTWLWLLLALGLLVVALGLWLVLSAGKGPPAVLLEMNRPPKAIPMAVLGDSDSHSYQDALYPAGSGRSSEFRERTFSWVESLARLRGNELDPGPWLTWGNNRYIAFATQLLGLPVGRAPRKQDYLYNFAYYGAICDDLTGRRMRQAPSLAALMAREPARWQHGVVVIRMGLNDWQGMLELQARDPHAAELDAAIAHCRDRIGAAMALLRQQQPGLHFLVVGIGNEIDDPSQFDRFRSAEESGNTAAALARFNGALRTLAEQTPGAAFFDQDAWFRHLWGSRTPEGLPIYRTVTVGSGFEVSNAAAGDDPHNALLDDHHAGTVWNALWAQSLVARLREAFGLPLTPVSDDELWRYLQPLVTPSKLRAPVP